jgi:hypothetical protein
MHGVMDKEDGCAGVASLDKRDDGDWKKSELVVGSRLPRDSIFSAFEDFDEKPCELFMKACVEDDN